MSADSGVVAGVIEIRGDGSTDWLGFHRFLTMPTRGEFVILREFEAPYRYEVTRVDHIPREASKTWPPELQPIVQLYVEFRKIDRTPE